MKVGTLEIELLANMARLQSDMDRAQRTVGNAVGKINNLLGAIGVGISVDFLLGLARKANEYSKSLAALSTQISGATGQIKELDAASRSLSVQFGTTAIKQSAGFYEILSAGITDTAQATALLTEANRLAIGGNAELMIAVDGLTSIIKGYGNAAGTAAEIADTMFTASLAGKLSIQELSEGIGKVIPLATTMGVSLEEITSAISALTLGGISAKESITGVRAILAAVAKPSSEAARLAKEIGLEFNSASIQANGFAKFLEDVKSKTQGSSDQMAILFGGVESLIPALALTGNAGVEFNNILDQMANKAGATEAAFDKMANSPGFKWDQFMSTMSNIAITLGDALANVLTPAAEMAAKALNKLFGFNNLSGVEKQIQLVGELTNKVESMANRSNIPLIGGLLFDKKEFDMLQHQLEMAKEDLSAMQKAQQSVGATQKQATVEIAKSTAALEKNNSVVAKAARVAEVRNKEFNIELYLLRQYESEAKRARDITGSVATEQEIFNQKLEELNRLKPYLTVETYNRALQKAQDELRGTATVTRTATDEVSQMWIQAGRNIQSTLANSIFNFFDDGLKGMLKNVISTVGRIASEFAALKVAQGVGLAGLFGASGAANASSGALSLASIGSSAANLGSSALNLFKVGGGISQGVSGLLGIGSSGTQAAAEAGATALWGTSGASASIGSSIASFAGPAIAVAAVDQIVRMLVGDKTLGGTAGKVLNFVPVLGPLINGLFGRGPMKQQGTLLEGQIGAEGFESGFLQTRFKAKGGAFRSDKIDFSRVDAVTGETFTDNGKLAGFTAELAEAGKQIFDSVNEATKQTTTALRGVASTLGLATGGIDNFNYSLSILTEKGEMIQGEQIAEEIAKISEGLALSLMPSIQDFQRSNETAVKALVRLNTEFISLDQAVQNLGATSGYANELIKSLSIQQRTQLVEMAGGVESLASMTSFFFTNFLTGSEQFNLKSAQLSTALQDLGLSANLGADEFKALVQNVNTSNELRIALLQLAPAFLEVRNAAGAVTETIMKSSTELLGDAFSSLRKSVDAERKKATDQYNTALAAVNSRIQSVTESISKLKSLSSALANTVDALRPLSREQAKFQILSAINTARAGGGLPDVADISRALNVLQSNNITGVKSSFELEREQAKTANLVADLGGLTNKQLSVEERSLMQLQDQRSALETGFSDEMLRLDSLLEQGQKEIDTLNGLNTTILSLATAIEQFNLRSAQAGGGTIGGGAIGGNPSISDQQIIDYFAVPRTPQEIARDAIANGVTSQQIIATGRFTQAEADQFFRENDVPRFAGGGYHRGGLRIVGERGPELERTGPSSITSNSDLKRSIGNDEVLAELRKLNKIFEAVTQNGTALRTRTA